MQPGAPLRAWAGVEHSLRHHKYRGNGGEPSFVDPAFAEALAGSEISKGRSGKPDYKTRQLCRQVQRTLHLALAGELNDDVLRELSVGDVLAPGGNAGHLLVQILVPTNVPIPVALEHLSRATPALRALVARAITRKRAPELSFIPSVGMEVQP